MFIRNVIFDLGEVIIRLDFEGMVKRFESLGLPRFDEFYRQRKLDLFDPFELGELSPAQFRQALRRHFDLKVAVVSDQQLDEAWNSWLGEIPEERLACIRKLKEQASYRIFLFSNTNPLHLEEIYKRYGKEVFQGCFEEEYYSYKFRQKKPNRSAFVSILERQGLNAGETVHIDDSLEHIHGARSAGLQVVHVAVGQGTERAAIPTVKSLIEAVGFIETHNRSIASERGRALALTPFTGLSMAERAPPKKSFFSCCFPFFKSRDKKVQSPVREEQYQYLPFDRTYSL